MTHDEVNALPERVRRYIHDLETNADPAGMVRANVLLREENAQLRALVGELSWQPIDTCPYWKRVLLWLPEMSGFAAQQWIGKRVGGDPRNHGYDERWLIATPYAQHNNGTGINQQVWMSDPPTPTHWMPLPELPAIDAMGSGGGK